MRASFMHGLRAVAALVAATGAAASQRSLPDELRALFEERRAIESASHRERIRILQEAEACIGEARDLRAFRACERAERAAREALRERLRPRVEALRERARALRARHRGGREVPPSGGADDV